MYDTNSVNQISLLTFWGKVRILKISTLLRPRHTGS